MKFVRGDFIPFRRETGRQVIVADTLELPYQRKLEAVIALEASKFEAPELLDMDNSRKARRSRQYGKSDSWKSKFNRNR